MIDEIVDDSGNLRRLGSLIPESLNLCGAPTFAEKYPAWSDDEIREAITDPLRKPARIIFGNTWIHNQGSFGSCNGWATAGVGARARYWRGIKDGKQFSGSFTYSRINRGVDQGSALYEGMVSIGRDGLCPIDLCKPNQIYKNQISSEAVTEAAKRKALVRTAYHISTIRELRTALAMRLPCVVAVHAGRNLQQLNKQKIAGVDNGRGNHSVLCDDLCIIGGHEVFDFANSWGLQYGDNGRAYLTEEHFAQTIGVHDFFAVGDIEEAGT